MDQSVSEISSTSSSKENNLAKNDSNVSIDENKSTVGSNKSQKNESTHKKRKREIEMESCDIRLTEKLKNVTETTVICDTSTSQIPVCQAPTKCTTKGEFNKYFALNKSPIPNIRLSFEVVPKAKSTERRNATFTCEADNEMILKKVERGGKWYQEFLDKYGSISEDEEDLIQLPAFDDEQTTELEQKDSQKLNTDNASRELNDTSALNSCASSLNCNTEICNVDKESRNSANISTELSGRCKKDSIQDNFRGSSELYLIMDEVENFYLLWRASEIGEDKFQKCDLFEAHVPKLDKITKISKVRDADFYTVFVNEPIEIHADTKIVQQHCKKDYVTEIKPALPIIDLTQESADRCVESFPGDNPGEMSIETKRELMEITERPPDHATITLYRLEENDSRQEHVQAGTIPSQFLLRNSSEADVQKDIDSEQKYLSDKKANISDKPSSNSPNLVQSLRLNPIQPKDDMLQTELSNTNSVVTPQKASEPLENENKLANSSIVNIAQPHYSNLITTHRPYLNNTSLKTAVSSAPLSINTLTAIAPVSPTGQNNVQSYSQSSILGSGQQKLDHSSIPKEINISGSVAKECNDNASKNIQVEISQAQSCGQHTGLPQRVREYRSVRRTMPAGTSMPPNLININKTPKLTQLLANPPKSDSDNINTISNINSTNKRNICSRTNQNKVPHNTQQHNYYDTAISSQVQLVVQEPICLDGNDASTSIHLKTNQNPRPSTNDQNNNASIIGPIHSRARNPTSINQATDVGNLANIRRLVVPPANENPPPITDQTCINCTEDTDELTKDEEQRLIEILTTYIYFLAHVCKERNDYVENLRKHSRGRSYFEKEIRSFEGQKRAHLLSFASELQQLNIGATRNLNGTALLIMNKVSTNLLNMDMPQQATKSMIYQFIYQLLKHYSRLFELSPFLKTLLKHCEIVVNWLYSTLGSAMTPDQRKILTQQINEYNKIVLRQKQINEGQFNVEPSRLNNSPRLGQIQICLPTVLQQRQEQSVTENKSAEEQPAYSLAVNPVQNNNSTDVEQCGLPQGSLVEPQLLTLGAEIRNPQHSIFDSPNIHFKDGRKEIVNSGAKVILNHIEGSGEEDIEVIDLTWTDYVDDNELQQDIDFVFVKKEDPEGQGYQNEPNKIVQSPADSGIFSPPVQTEDDTTDYKVSVEKLCVCTSTALYKCICGLAVYCGRECQSEDWYSHQKVCPFAQKETETEGDSTMWES